MGKRVARRDLAKELRWRELVAKHRDSDLSVREFCAAEGVAENSFYAWRRELALRDAESDTAKGDGEQKKLKNASPHPIRKSSTSSSGAAAFVPVTLSSLPHAAAVEMALPSGVTLRVAAGCDEATLRTVLSALEASSC